MRKIAQQGAPAAVLPPLRYGKTAAELGRCVAERGQFGSRSDKQWLA